MSTPPLPKPSDVNVSDSYWWSERVYLLGVLLINALLALQVAHVLRWPVYQVSAPLHFVVAWTIATNLLCAAVLCTLQPKLEWNYTRLFITLGDWSVSLLPLVMIRVLRMPAFDHRQRVFGFVYALFVFGRLAVLIGWTKLFRERRRSTIRAALFLAAFVVYFAITPWIEVAVSTNGDEPHYLLLTHSLVHDHDFDLRNNYDQQDYLQFYAIRDLSGRHIIVNQRGQQMPFHDVGLSVLLVPGYAMGNRLGAMVENNLLAALLSVGIFELAMALGATTAGAISCWGLFAFVSPLVTFSVQIYPEIAGAAFMIWAVVYFARFLETRSPTALPITGCLLALIPWLSIRFWVVLGPVALMMAIYVMVQVRPSRLLLRSIAWLAIPSLVSLLVFCLFDLWMLGKFEPNAGYLLYVPTMSTPMFRPQLQVGLLGLLFDKAFGLLPTAPIYLVAIAGIWTALRTNRALALTLLLPVAVFILFAATNHWWYGGVTPPPSRYILIALAMLAPFAGPALSRARSSVVVGVLAGWSFLVAFEFTAFPVPRHAFWEGASAGVVAWISDRGHVAVGRVFPSMMRAAGADYLLAGVWAAVAVVVLVVILRSTKGSAQHYARR